MEAKARAVTRWGRLCLRGGVALLALVGLAASLPALSYPLRSATASLAAALLRLAGFAVTLDETVIGWNASSFAVAEECSGVRKVWACVFLALGLAHFRGLGARPTVLLVAVAVVAALAANVLRVAGLFYLEVVLGRQDALLHDLFGLATFGLAVGAVAVAAGRLTGASR
jgi:exosortase